MPHDMLALFFGHYSVIVFLTPPSQMVGTWFLLFSAQAYSYKDDTCSNLPSLQLGGQCFIVLKRDLISSSGIPLSFKSNFASRVKS